MFAGVQEILVLVIIILAIFLLPRIFSKEDPAKAANFSVSGVLSTLTGKMRLALIMSLVWPLTVAGYLQPWKTGVHLFLYVGLGPVFVGWGVRWIAAGFKRPNRSQ